jgi:hypothetical protein
MSKNEKQSEEDLELVRSNYIDLLNKGNKALDGLIDLATDEPHHSNYKVLAGFMLNLASINKDLAGHHKGSEESDEAAKITNQTNNTLQITATDLQKTLQKTFGQIVELDHTENEVDYGDIIEEENNNDNEQRKTDI